MMMVFAVKSFEPVAHLDFSQIAVIYILGSFGVVVPSPGGIGTYQYMLIIGLGLYGINQADAFSFSNIAFLSAQFFALVVYGIISVIILYFFIPVRKMEGRET